MNIKRLFRITAKNSLFWLSRKIDYPLLPPDAVQVNFTFDCNLRCKMCGMHKQKQIFTTQNRQTEINSQTLKSVIEQTKELGVKNIIFIGGEPLLRKDIFELLQFSKKFNLNTTLVTNGVLLDEEAARNCLEAEVDCLSVSIDAATDKVFRQIRNEDILPVLIKNLNLLNSLKRALNKTRPHLIAVCTIMDDNIEELPEIVELCKSLGMEKIIFQPIVSNNIDQAIRESSQLTNITPERLTLLDASIDKLMLIKNSSPKNFDFIANSTKNMKLIKKYFRNTVSNREYLCYAGYNRLQIVQEGKVYFCVDQKRFEATFGNIATESLKDLWFSNKARFFRRQIKICRYPCLQWCSFRDDFIELSGWLEKITLFNTT
jgi:radical SAM protein with 4Fe4S-binding SPASM domain